MADGTGKQRRQAQGQQQALQSRQREALLHQAVEPVQLPSVTDQAESATTPCLDTPHINFTVRRCATDTPWTSPSQTQQAPIQERTSDG